MAMQATTTLPLCWHNWLTATQDTLRSAGRFRSLREVTSQQGAEITLNGRRCVHFCSNDYLSLAGNAWLAERLTMAVSEWGTGSGASRLVSGNQTPHVQLENRLATWWGGEAALLFGSGWHANTGIPAALGRETEFFSDQLNHASLIDGMRLARATVSVYPHSDMEKLRQLLAGSRCQRKVIVSDAVFSMDGDLAPIRELTKLAAEYDALLYVDEAHATGILGTEFAGLGSGVSPVPAIRMGTLGKAFGLFGAFVVVPNILREQFVNQARSQIFATGLPPAIAAVAIDVIDWIQAHGDPIRAYTGRAAHLAEQLRDLGFDIPPTQTPILPILIGDDHQTMQICERLLELGIFIQGIRPPTVPSGTARLRMTVQLGHTTEHLDRLLDAFARL